LSPRRRGFFHPHLFHKNIFGCAKPVQNRKFLSQRFVNQNFLACGKEFFQKMVDLAFICPYVLLGFCFLEKLRTQRKKEAS
jgi:hypothetical protein